MRTALLITCLVPLLACNLRGKKSDGGAEATTTTVATADTAIVDAGPPAPIASNEKDIKRFSDEEKIDGEVHEVEWSTVAARKEPVSGAQVASLKKGTKCTLIAKKGKSALATFADPKDATSTLMGWIADDAFVPGTTPVAITRHADGGVSAPKTGVCGPGQTLLMGDDAFCGKICSADKDCAAPLVCQSQAKPITAAGLGPATNVCAKKRATTDAGTTPAATVTATASGAPGFNRPSVIIH